MIERRTVTDPKQNVSVVIVKKCIRLRCCENALESNALNPSVLPISEGDPHFHRHLF